MFWCDFVKDVFIYFQMNFPSSILPSVATVYIENEKPEKPSKTSSQNEFNSSDASHHHKACFCFSLVNITHLVD